MYRAWLRVLPDDVLLFRDGRPFSAGESSFAASRFPPLPSTFAGALRTALADILFQSQYDLFGDATLSTLRFFGPLPARFDPDCHPLLPLPADVLIRPPTETASTSSDHLNRLVTRKIPPYLVTTSDPSPSAIFWNAYSKGKAAKDTWIGLKTFEAWRQNRPIGSAVLFTSSDSQRSLYEIEPRPGIRIDPQRLVVAESDAFFFVHYLRLDEQTGFLLGLSLDAVQPEPQKTLRSFLCPGRTFRIHLGGERHMAHVTVLDTKDPLGLSPSEAQVVQKGTSVRGLLLTPAWFDPQQPIVTDNLGKRVQIKISAITAAAPMVTYTGWDYQKNAPKPPKTCYPPGTVLEWTFQDTISAASFSIGKWTSLGFGWLLPGRPLPNTLQTTQQPNPSTA